MIEEKQRIHISIDVVKLIMAILVVGIHVEPFILYIWLDRGFGIITRLCVPYFFISSSYLFWCRGGKPYRYVKRLLLLYCVWVIIYLPYHFSMFRQMDILNIIFTIIWYGYGHLWYMNSTIIGFIIVWLLSKKLNSKLILIISIIFLIIGCMKSTWAPLLQNTLNVQMIDKLGSKNGLFYAFPYIALGKYISERKTISYSSRDYIGLCLCTILLIAESCVFVLLYKTESTVLFVSVLPLSYFLFKIILSIDIKLQERTSVLIRNISTLVYFIHLYVIKMIRSNSINGIVLYIITISISIIISYIIIRISNKTKFAWLRYLY